MHAIVEQDLGHYLNLVPSFDCTNPDLIVFNAEFVKRLVVPTDFLYKVSRIHRAGKDTIGRYEVLYRETPRRPTAPMPVFELLQARTNECLRPGFGHQLFQERWPQFVVSIEHCDVLAAGQCQPAVACCANAGVWVDWMD